MANAKNDNLIDLNRSGGISRRHMLVGGASLSLLGINGVPAFGAAAEPGNLELARKEGPLRLIHIEQETDAVKYLKVFTDKTGIEVLQQRVNTSELLQKLDAEIRSPRDQIDVCNCAEVGVINQFAKRGSLLEYASPELAAYSPDQYSRPPGFWSLYCQNVSPMMYDAGRVSAADAPKTWMDLLDPKWKGKIGFQSTVVGPTFGHWFLLKDLLPADYWDRLADQKPRGYQSSTQLMADLINGSILVGGSVSIFQYAKARRQGAQITMVFPPEGTPSNFIVTAIRKETPRPNAAKIFVDYLLSQQGQQSFHTIQGSFSARKDVHVPDVPDLSNEKMLFPKEFDTYATPANYKRFTDVWRKLVGM